MVKMNNTIFTWCLIISKNLFSQIKCNAWSSLVAWLKTINTNWREVVETSRLLVVRRVVQAPLGCWYFLRERLGVAPLATEALVFRHWALNISHHYFIIVGHKVIMDSTCGLWWALIMPIDSLVISSADLICWSIKPVRMPGSGAPGMPVRMLPAPFLPASPGNVWMTAMICFYFM